MFDFIASIPVIGSVITLILPFLIVISIVVFIHEYGHYIIGRWCGIHAETFSLGMGRPLKSWTDKRGTKWQIAAVPLGGYVKFLGDMNSASTESEAPDENLAPSEQSRYFASAKLYKRALTVLAGPVFNFILSFVLFTGLVIWSGKPTEEPIIGTIHPALEQNFDLRSGDLVQSIDGVAMENFGDLGGFLDAENPKQIMPYQIERDGATMTVDGPFPLLAIVGSVSPVSPASKAGLLANDLILTFDSKPVTSFGQLRDLVFGSEPAEREITVLRNGEKVQLSIFPRVREFQAGDGSISKEVSIGVTSGNAFTSAIETVAFGDAIKYGASRTWEVLVRSVDSISMIISGQISVKNLQGPIGIAHVSSDIVKSGVINFIALIAVISTSIGFLNLLPIPVLDGGHLLMFAYEALTGRKPNDKVIHYGTLVAISALLTLMVFVSFNDIVRMVLFWA
jgi:regulator of sigma E protease